jgi:hypothetical protein
MVQRRSGRELKAATGRTAGTGENIEQAPEAGFENAPVPFSLPSQDGLQAGEALGAPPGAITGEASAP